MFISGKFLLHINAVMLPIMQLMLMSLVKTRPFCLIAILGYICGFLAFNEIKVIYIFVYVSNCTDLACN